MKFKNTKDGESSDHKVDSKLAETVENTIKEAAKKADISYYQWKAWSSQQALCEERCQGRGHYSG